MAGHVVRRRRQAPRHVRLLQERCDEGRPAQLVQGSVRECLNGARKSFRLSPTLRRSALPGSLIPVLGNASCRGWTVQYVSFQAIVAEQRWGRNTLFPLSQMSRLTEAAKKEGEEKPAQPADDVKAPAKEAEQKADTQPVGGSDCIERKLEIRME